jgi:hypothetical protein
MKNVYVMWGSVFTRLLNRFGKVECFRCNKPICIGDLVVSSGNTSRVKIYHKACFDKLYVDV